MYLHLLFVQYVELLFVQLEKEHSVVCCLEMLHMD